MNLLSMESIISLYSYGSYSEVSVFRGVLFVIESVRVVIKLKFKLVDKNLSSVYYKISDSVADEYF